MKLSRTECGVGKFVEAVVPGVFDPFTVDDRRVEGIDRKHRETDFARQLFARRAFLVVSGAGGEGLALIFLEVGVAAEVRFFFEKEEIALAKEVGGAEATGAAADDDNVVVLRNWGPREGVTVADLMADVEIVAFDLSFGIVGRCEQREINRATRCY